MELGAGSWELGAGSWELGAGSWELGAGSIFKSPEYEIKCFFGERHARTFPTF